MLIIPLEILTAALFIHLVKRGGGDLEGRVEDGESGVGVRDSFGNCPKRIGRQAPA